MRHHYVPQFLLRRWVNANRKLRSYTWHGDRLTWADRGPKSTGYEEGLYAIVACFFGYPEDHLEKRLFGPIDSNAAVALAKIETQAVLSEDDHIAWTFFLASLRMRQPDVLEFLRTDAKQHQAEILAELDAGTLPAGALTTKQWFDHHFRGATDASSLASWLPRMILHEEVLDRFAGLHWWCREFQPDAPKLLLGEQPLYWNGGADPNSFYIHLPIGPDRIFFGTGSAETEQALSALAPAELVRRVNRATIAASSKRFWGTTDNASQAFVEANLDIIGVDVVPFRNYAPWNRAPAAEDQPSP